MRLLHGQRGAHLACCLGDVLYLEMELPRALIERRAHEHALGADRKPWHSRDGEEELLGLPKLLLRTVVPTARPSGGTVRRGEARRGAARCGEARGFSCLMRRIEVRGCAEGRGTLGPARKGLEGLGRAWKGVEGRGRARHPWTSSASSAEGRMASREESKSLGSAALSPASSEAAISSGDRRNRERAIATLLAVFGSTSVTTWAVRPGGR